MRRSYLHRLIKKRACKICRHDSEKDGKEFCTVCSPTHRQHWRLNHQYLNPNYGKRKNGRRYK